MKIFYHSTERGVTMGVPDDADIQDYPDYQEVEPAYIYTELEIRQMRDDLLSKTDFYALSDVTMPENVRTYRQALRDIPSQEGFPNNVTWPTITE